MIFLPITSNCFLHVFFWTSTKDENIEQQRCRSQYQALGFIILSLAHDHFYLGKIVQLLKGKCDIFQILLLLLDFYHWFSVLPIIWFSCFHFLQHKNTGQKYPVIIFSYRVGALNRGLIRGLSWLLWVRLVYSWKSTGTLVAKLSMVW